MNSSERRSSSRSIKRKRFDDEIVDYALPPPVNRGRQRANSQSANVSLTSVPSEPSSPSSMTQLLPLPPLVPLSTNTVAVAHTTVPEIKSEPPVLQPVASTTRVVQPPSQVVIKVEKDPVISTTYSPVQKQTSSPAVSPLVALAPLPSLPVQIKQEPSSSPSSNQVPLTPSQFPIIPFASSLAIPLASAPMFQGDRKLKSSKKKGSKNRGLNQMSTKDLGRWKPVDDLALIIGVQQTNDLKMVHRGTKFSCKFTLNELQNRWYSLLYEESISRIAVAAMRNLHPELVENIQSKALYTTQEEDILATIKSTEIPVLDTFQELLRKHSSIFYTARTPKSLQSHWQLMKQYQLLPDQAIKVPGKDGTILSFSDNEDLLNDAELTEPRDESLDVELALVDRRNKREIRQLESELGRWNVLVDSMTGMGFPPEFDRQTLAVLRGRLVRYLMRSREITIGRSTKDSTVDVDLGLEGPAFKVSRKQGTIKLRSNADFFLTNEGKRPIYVDGMALLTGYKTRLSHNCTIEIAGLRFTFLVNFDLINAIQQESAKMNIALT